MPADAPYFSFRCDVAGRFALVNLRHGSITWQVARVSSTTRLLLPGIVIALVLGGLWTAIFWNVLGQNWFAHAGAIVMAVIVAFLGGYQLGLRTGNVLFPINDQVVQRISVKAKPTITTRRGSRVFSFVTLTSGSESVEFRISTAYVKAVTDKLRATQPR